MVGLAFSLDIPVHCPKGLLHAISMRRWTSILTWSHISIRVLLPVEQAHLVHGGVEVGRELREQAQLGGREQDKREEVRGEEVEPQLSLHAEDTALLLMNKQSKHPESPRAEEWNHAPGSPQHQRRHPQSRDSVSLSRRQNRR